MDPATPSTAIARGGRIGTVTHYFSKIGVAVVELTGSLKVGESIVIAGRGHEFVQPIGSLQVEHEQVSAAKKGDAVGLKVSQPVKTGDAVFLPG